MFFYGFGFMIIKLSMDLNIWYIIKNMEKLLFNDIDKLK